MVLASEELLFQLAGQVSDFSTGSKCPRGGICKVLQLPVLARAVPGGGGSMCRKRQVYWASLLGIDRCWAGQAWDVALAKAGGAARSPVLRALGAEPQAWTSACRQLRH